MWYRGTELLHPEQILRDLGVRPGWSIGDFGCGSIGHFVFPAAHLVGGEGKVYAVDIQRPALKSIERGAHEAQLWNVYPVWSDLERPRATNIPEKSLDLALVCNTLHLVQDPAQVLEEAFRLTRPGGILLIIEWRKEPSVLGPPLEDRLSDEEIYQHINAQPHPIHWTDRFTAGMHHDGFVFQKGGFENMEPDVISVSNPF